MIYRRHRKRCPQRKLKRRYWRCECPIWIDARVSGRRVLKSLEETDWEAAQGLEKQWIAGNGAAVAIEESTSRIPMTNAAPLTLEDGWRRFIAQAEVRKLHTSTVYKYRLLQRQMLEFAQRRGIQSLKDFDLEVLEAFQAEGREGSLTALRKLGRVRAFFRFAFERRWIDSNPARSLRGPKVRPVLPCRSARKKWLLFSLLLNAIKTWRAKLDAPIRCVSTHSFSGCATPDCGSVT